MTTLYVDNIAPNLQSKISAPNLQLPSGSVVQVVQTVKTDTFGTASTSFVDITGLSVSITPSSTSNKILVLGSLSGNGNHATFSTQPQLVRDSTPIFVATGSGSRTQALAMLEVAVGAFATIPITFLDEPSTTDEVTYKIRLRVNSGSYTGYINRGLTDTDSAIYARAASSLVVMEIAG